MPNEYISTRRGFFKNLFFIGTGSFAFLLGLRGLNSIRAKESGESFLSKIENSRVTNKFGKNKFKYFNKHQGATVVALASLIIPTDQDPGSNEAGVVFYIDDIVGGSEAKLQQYDKGIRWLDNYSETKFGKGKNFIDLGQRDQLKILKNLEETSQILYQRFGYLPQEKWRKRIDYIKKTISYRVKLAIGGPELEGVLFFKTVKGDVFDGFYASPISWQMIHYQGPPQFNGYHDYGKCHQKT